MGLTLILEVHNIIIYNLCRYIEYNNLSIYKLMPLFLWHVSMLYTFSYMLIAHTTMLVAQKLYNTKFVIVNMTKIVANDNQLHAKCIVSSYKWQDF